MKIATINTMINRNVMSAIEISLIEITFFVCRCKRKIFKVFRYIFPVYKKINKNKLFFFVLKPWLVFQISSLVMTLSNGKEVLDYDNVGL